MILTTRQRQALRFATPADTLHIRTALHGGAEIITMAVSDEMANECYVFSERTHTLWFSDLKDGDVARAIHPKSDREVIIRISKEDPYFIHFIDASGDGVDNTGTKFLIPLEVDAMKKP